jgi:hypothetical protein
MLSKNATEENKNEKYINKKKTRGGQEVERFERLLIKH